MNILDKIRFLTDKKDGLGIPMQIIGRYCGCHPTGITYYLKGQIAKQEVLDKYETGINQLVKDFDRIMKGE